MKDLDLASIRQFARESHAEALELLRTLARIPAPSHHEQQRADFICTWLHANGMPEAFIDEATNVVCPLAEAGTREFVVFAAHTDVVFDDTDELPLREENGRLFAPGVGDDTANLVGLLMCARYLARHRELLPRDLGFLIVANSCEEGLGNLKGTRQLFAAYEGRIRRYYSFDLYIPNIVDSPVGSHRWRISVKTQGGHSLKNFGRPNAIERLSAIIGSLYQLALPTDITATLNVGTIEGGTTVNAIAANANCLFEYRSTSEAVLQDLRGQMMDVLDRYRTPEVHIEAELVGQRPAAADVVPQEQEPLTQLTKDVIASVTGESPRVTASSTDANVPFSLGIPANAVGAIRGALSHTRDEWVDTASLEDGIAIILGVMLGQGQLSR